MYDCTFDVAAPFTKPKVGSEADPLYLVVEMEESVDEGDPRHEAIAATLRAVREHRRIKIADLASAMGMARRTYQNFETGRTRLNLVHLFQFAAITRSDPMGLWMAILLGAPEFGVRTIENSLGSALMMETQAFNERVGDGMLVLRAHQVVKAFRQAFEALEAEIGGPDPTAEWIDRQMPSRPPPADADDDKGD